MLAQIVALVAEAQRSRAPLQRIVDRVSAWFVPAVVVCAVLAFAGWLLVGPDPRAAHALIAAISVLVIACLCELGLATPISMMVASGRGAHMGVLFRNAGAIEALRDVDILLIDKTGTLTEGKPSLQPVEPAAGFTAAQVLAWAAALEQPSEHPLARAILAGAALRGLGIAAVEDFRDLPDRGVKGRVDGHVVAIGNAKLLPETGVTPDPGLASRTGALRHEGATVMLVAVDGRPAGFVAVADQVRADTAAALDQLRGEGLRVVMLTGDNATTARAIARRLGIDEVCADVSPVGKAAAVGDFKSLGRKVAMAGDGINDAPALAAADVGIAMGSGTEIAVQSAAVTLVRGNLAGIARARALSRATVRNIHQNLGWAFGYNAIGIPIAAGVLFPWFGILLSPMLAALAMSLSSVSVVSNALRLRGARLDAPA